MHNNETISKIELQRQNDIGSQNQSEETEQNIIKKTRQIIRGMDQQQRFEKAIAHMTDALNYRSPRPNSQSLSTPTCFRVLYAIKCSSGWEMLLFILSYVQMYLVVIDNQAYATKIGVQSTILLLFWVDLVMKKYLKSFDLLGKKKEVVIFDWRTIILSLMTIDLLIFIIVPGFGSRPIRPFRVLRCVLPLMYDSSLRQTFFAMASAHMDIFVFISFFAIVVFGFALVGNRTLTIDPYFRDPKNPIAMDPYTNDYESLSRMIFSIYILSSFDNFPDNEWFSIQNYKPNYIFFVVFIFLNYFLFTIIPGSLVYNKFRQTCSKLILINEIKQQHSLIIAFVTLAGEDTYLDFDVFVKFLYALYRHKQRYVEFIADICIKVDENNDNLIQVRQFMHLGRTILDNSAMMPPSFDDVKCWVSFRRFMKERFKLKIIVQHWIFQLTVTILIVFSFVNALILSYDVWETAAILDDIFVWIFLVELMLRVIAFGPETFFTDRWNNLDSVLVFMGLFFFFLPIQSGASSIARIGRIFRVASLLRVISHSNFMDLSFRFIMKLRMLFQVLLQIMPIILKFIPLVLFAFFAFGIIGMQLFYNSYSTEGSPNYNGYAQFANFKTFLSTQFLLVQIMIEQGWSTIAYDHCWRSPQYSGYILIYFCLMHLVIAFIICTLIKGIFWEVYFTVDRIFTHRDMETRDEELAQMEEEKKNKEISQIKQSIHNKIFTNPETLLKRELCERKMDELIFMKLVAEAKKEKELDSPTKKALLKSRRMQTEGFFSEFEISQNFQQSFNKLSILLNEYSDDSSQGEIEQIFHKILLDPKVKYSHVVGSGFMNDQFIRQKFVNANTIMPQDEFILSENLDTEESLKLHMSEMNIILHIESTKKQKKQQILKVLRDKDIIQEDKYKLLLKKKLHQMVFKIDTNGTLRKLFLSQTNSTLLRKFQIEYFSHLYGKSFQDINRITLEPLLKVESNITYVLRNILRFRKIKHLDFFQKLAHVEDQYSNKVLKKGSLFKFLYKLEEDNTWFSIEFQRKTQNELKELKIHFVKSGVWCYNKEMEEKEVYYARDVFHWAARENESLEEKKLREQFLKRFYQNFQGFAFSLFNQKDYFSSNPHKYIYDLYVQTFETGKMKRFEDFSHKISKIMVIALSEEERREEVNASEIPYQLTDLKIKEEVQKFQFTFDDSENDTFQKLKNLTAKDHQKIVQSQGLPFPYIINLMQEMNDTFKCNGQNFTFQVESVFNELFNLLKEKENSEAMQKTNARQQTLGKNQNQGRHETLELPERAQRTMLAPQQFYFEGFE